MFRILGCTLQGSLAGKPVANGAAALTKLFYTPFAILSFGVDLTVMTKILVSAVCYLEGYSCDVLEAHIGYVAGLRGDAVPHSHITLVPYFEQKSVQHLRKSEQLLSMQSSSQDSVSAHQRISISTIATPDEILSLLINSTNQNASLTIHRILSTATSSHNAAIVLMCYSQTGASIPLPILIALVKQMELHDSTLASQVSHMLQFEFDFKVPPSEEQTISHPGRLNLHNLKDRFSSNCGRLERVRRQSTRP